jgi:hypothetical protein
MFDKIRNLFSNYDETQSQDIGVVRTRKVPSRPLAYTTNIGLTRQQLLPKIEKPSKVIISINNTNSIRGKEGD